MGNALSLGVLSLFLGMTAMTVTTNTAPRK